MSEENNILNYISNYCALDSSALDLINKIKEAWEGEGFFFEDNTLELKTNGNANNEEIVSALKRQGEFWALFHEDSVETDNETKHVFSIGDTFLKSSSEETTNLSELKGIYTTEDIIKEFYEESFKELDKIDNINQLRILTKKLLKLKLDADMPEKILKIKEQKWRKL